jgi:hypothetical protein
MNAATIEKPETTEPETFDVPEGYIEKLEAKLEKFARRAEKLGMSPITYEVVGEKFIKERAEGYAARVRRLVVIKLVGSAPVLDGYTFVARTEHTAAGNIISKAPGAEGIHVPAELRDGGSYCDHCKTARNRIDTFILQTPSGALMRVGRNCLADFIRSQDPAVAIALWSIIADLRKIGSDEEDEGLCFSWDYMTAFIVAAAFRSVELNGWVSRKESRSSDEGPQSTADAAMFAGNPPPRDPRRNEEWKAGQPTEADFAKANEAIEWAKTLPGANDYEHNLKVALSLYSVTERNVGVVASVVIAYQRYLEKAVAAARAEKKASGYFGRVDGRYIRTLTVLKAVDIHGDFGLTVLYTLEDAEGNQFKWFSSGGASAPVEPVRGLQAGDSFAFLFTVKKHENYKGTDGTVLTRAGAAKTAADFNMKWIHPKTGEVFKTKKALAEALAV